MATPEVERLVNRQQFVDLLIGKVNQLHVRYMMRYGPLATRHCPPYNVKIWVQTLTANTFWGHALGKNGCLVNVRPEADQDGVGGDTLFLRHRLHDSVMGEGRTGGSKRGVSRDGDPLRLREFHEFGLSARRVKFDLVDRRDDGRVF